MLKVPTSLKQIHCKTTQSTGIRTETVDGYRVLFLSLLFLLFSVTAGAQINAPETETPIADSMPSADPVDQLEQPLYTPFIERYMLDELKSLRVDLAATRTELIQQLVDREIEAVDRSVTYATNTVTYFFYLIAGVSSILVLVGWSSIRDIKERVHTLADEQITTLVNEYEQRLIAIEKQLSNKTRHIEENREEIELTREVHALWLRAAQEHNPHNKISIYDQILALNPNDTEALTYKADAVLEVDEPQWAINLCRKALEEDPKNTHGLYQLACAHATLGRREEAINYLSQVIEQSENYYDDLKTDPALNSLRDYPPFQNLINVDPVNK